MRKRIVHEPIDFNVIICDDDPGLVDSLKAVLGRLGYNVSGFTDPFDAIDSMKSIHYDILILDFILEKINGDKLIDIIREFNSSIYILILTGHRELAPPIETLKNYDIQGYCEKTDRFDQVLLMIESAIKSVRLMRSNKRFEEGLNQILMAVPKIYQLQPIDKILEDILTEILPFANSTDAFILVDDISDEETNTTTIFKGIGKFNICLEDFVTHLEPLFLEQIGACRNTLKPAHLDSGVLIPLVSEFKNALGVIYIKSDCYSDALRLLEIFTQQASASISNAYLHSLVNIKKEQLKKTYEDLKRYYVDTVEALRLTVDAKDVFTRGHSDRVAFYASALGLKLNLREEDIELLKIAGQFHDIGKIGTAEDILLKTERLDYAEFSEIKKHPLKSAHILSAVSIFRDAVPVVKHHHERIDGNGYPDGLVGEEIPYLARIITVADAFDAMTSDRLYRTKLGVTEALNQLYVNSDNQFDKEIVKVFIALVKENFTKWQECLADSFTKI